MNTEGDVLDQYETFNGMPVYYGGDLYDWAYVEDYNFGVPEGMDLMVHRHRQDPDCSDVRQNWQMDMISVCQTMCHVSRGMSGIC